MAGLVLFLLGGAGGFALGVGGLWGRDHFWTWYCARHDEKGSQQ